MYIQIYIYIYIHKYIDEYDWKFNFVTDGGKHSLLI